MTKTRLQIIMQPLDKRCLWDGSILVCCNRGYIQHRYIEGKYNVFVQAFETGSKTNIWWGLLNTCLWVSRNICYLYRQYTYIVYPAISKGPKQFLIFTEISRNRRRSKRIHECHFYVRAILLPFLTVCSSWIERTPKVMIARWRMIS
jgi:hypothetical protein